MNTVRCRYNAVNFLQNPHTRHPIAHPWGWGMRCRLCAQTLIHILLQSLQWCMQYHVILDRVKLAPDSIRICNDMNTAIAIEQSFLNEICFEYMVSLTIKLCYDMLYQFKCNIPIGHMILNLVLIVSDSKGINLLYHTNLIIYSVSHDWMIQENPVNTLAVDGSAPCVDRSTASTILAMCMMTSSNGNIFRVTGPLCGEFTGHRWIPHAKGSDAELWCFLWSALE